jgi:hypothetical protein
MITLQFIRVSRFSYTNKEKSKHSLIKEISSFDEYSL